MSGPVGLHHVQLTSPVGSEEASRWFYGTVLGLPEVAKPSPLAGRADVLASHGVPVEWDDPFPGFVRCYVADPHGNRLELLEPLTPSAR